MGYGIITNERCIDLHNELKCRDKIYHIFKESVFEEVIRTGTLRFKNVTHWKDPWELPSRYIKKIENDEKEYIKFLTNENNRLLFGQCVGMCFCKQYDKEAMWQYYTQGETGICIESTVEDMIDSLKLDDVLGGFVGPVLYLDFMGEKAKNLLINERALDYPSYMYMGYIKRDNYEYEEEIRVLLLMNEEVSGDFVEIHFDVQKLVKKIYLSPGLSEDEIERLRRKYRSLNVEIDFSKLYMVDEINIPKLSDGEIRQIMTSGGLPQNTNLLYYRLDDRKWVKYIK